MVEQEIRKWAREVLKAEHKINKIKEFKHMMSILCSAAMEDGEMPAWMIKGTAEEVLSGDSYR